MFGIVLQKLIIAMANDIGDDDNDFLCADIPDNMKDTRACLRCSLIKTFQQVCDYEILYPFTH